MTRRCVVERGKVSVRRPKRLIYHSGTGEFYKWKPNPFMQVLKLPTSSDWKLTQLKYRNRLNWEVNAFNNFAHELPTHLLNLNTERCFKEINCATPRFRHLANVYLKGILSLFDVVAAHKWPELYNTYEIRLIQSEKRNLKILLFSFTERSKRRL